VSYSTPFAAAISPSLTRNEYGGPLHDQAKLLCDGTSAIAMKNSPVAGKKSVAAAPRRDKYMFGIDRLHTKLA
jgi:hypothetical protein